MPSTTDVPLTCFKCNTQPPYTASRDGRRKPYCKACFVKYVETGIRDAFFRLCGVPTDVPVVLAVSGGAGSVALLEMASRIRRENLNRGGAGKIVYDLQVLHINETGCCTAAASHDASATAQCAAVAAFVRGAAKEADLPYTELPLARLVDPEALSRVHGRAPLTDREDLYQLLRRNAILNAATALGANAVVFGDTATTSAWRSLGEIVRGRGEHVRTFNGFHGLMVVGPQRELFLYRPVRGLLAKEAALYCRAKGLRADYLPGIATGSGQRSIDRTLEAFVTTLETTYRSTVFNVLNSVDRIGPQADRAALARGSSTVTKEDGTGKRALKQHLHEVITSMLRGSVLGLFGGRGSSSSSSGGGATPVAQEPPAAPETSEDNPPAAPQRGQCLSCGVPLHKACRPESGSQTAAEGISAMCYGCSSVATLHPTADGQAGHGIGAQGVQELLAQLAAAGGDTSAE